MFKPNNWLNRTLNVRWNKRNSQSMVNYERRLNFSQTSLNKS